MHRDLKKLLHGAKGESGFVLAQFLDVRGFSSFARMAESSEAAVFLRGFYTQVLDDYYPNATFFKPTGDGLLIIHEVTDENLHEIVPSVVSTAIKLVSDFPTIADDDPMINFPVPNHIGCGIARGAATRLVSGKKTLDYSGRPLNLAARLMDLARPTGVVIDDGVGVELIPQELMAAFTTEAVYLRGVAEEDPISVHYTSDQTELSAAVRHPIKATNWHYDTARKTKFSDIKARGPRFLHTLAKKPSDVHRIKLNVSFPATDKSGKKSPTVIRAISYDGIYQPEAQEPQALFDYDKIVALMTKQGVKNTWEVTTQIQYPVLPRPEKTT